jgi:hypothetical protein
MRNLKSLFPVVAIALLCTTINPTAKASAWDKKTIVTFDKSVEIPGQVLPAGTYIFTLLDSASGSRNIVQIWNEDQSQLIATTQTISTYVAQPFEGPVIRLQDYSPDSPMVIRSWFYPGETDGHEFVYSESQSQELASH